MTSPREWLQQVREERWGLLVDLIFAIVWVTMVDLIFQVLDGPVWAYYMFMIAGIIAYFGLFWNLELAKSQR